MSKKLAHQINTLRSTLFNIYFEAKDASPLALEAEDAFDVLASAWTAPIRDLHRHTSHLVIGYLISEVIAARLASKAKRDAFRKDQERACFTLEARAHLRS